MGETVHIMFLLELMPDILIRKVHITLLSATDQDIIKKVPLAVIVFLVIRVVFHMKPVLIMFLSEMPQDVIILVEQEMYF